MKNFEELKLDSHQDANEGISRRAVLGATAGALISFTLTPLFSKPFLEKANAATSGGVVNGFVKIILLCQ